MKSDKLFQFLGEFLEWNFSRLDSTILSFICGSPSVALHLYRGLAKMKIHSQIVAIVPSGPDQGINSDKLRDFLEGRTSSLKKVPLHFAVSVQSSGETAMFDAGGEIIGRDNCIRIGEIHCIAPLLYGRITTACTQGVIDKAIRYSTLENLAINFNRLPEHLRFWTPGNYTAKTGWVPFSAKMDFTGLDDLMDEVGNGVYKKDGRYVRRKDNSKSNSSSDTNPNMPGIRGDNSSPVNKSKQPIKKSTSKASSRRSRREEDDFGGAL